MFDAITINYRDAPVTVDMFAPGAALALYRRDWPHWAFLAARLWLDEDDAYELAMTACTASLARFPTI